MDYSPTEVPFASISGRVRDGLAAPWIKRGEPLFGFDPENPLKLEISEQDIERIISIDADLVRTRAIAQAYHLIGREVASALGLDDYANWWDFATWASATIAWSVDVEYGWQPPKGFRGPIPASRFAKLLPPATKTVSNQFLTQANRYVFAEMGCLGWQVIQASEEFLNPVRKDFRTFRDSVEVTLRRSIFGEGRPELLRFGLDALYDAVHASTETPDDVDEERFRRNKMLVASMAFFEYEQSRLEGYLDVLLSGRPLARWIELRDLRTYRGPGAKQKRFGSLRRAAATRFLSMHFPDKSYSMNKTAARAVNLPEGLLKSDQVYLNQWLKGNEKRLAAWTTLEFRMSRLMPIFEERVDSAATMEAPFDTDEISLIARGLDPRNHNRESDEPGRLPMNNGRPIDELRSRDEDRDKDWPDLVDGWVSDHPHLSLRQMVNVIAIGCDPLKKVTIDDRVRGELYEHSVPLYPNGRSHEDCQDAMKNARVFFRDNLAAVGASLFFGVLPTDMAAAEGALVLHQAGGFLADVSKRVDNTTAFLLSVMNTQLGTLRQDVTGKLSNEDFVAHLREETDPLYPKGRALGTIRMTRVIHHVIRAWLLNQNSRGPLDVWSSGRAVKDCPINAEDQLGTFLSFTVALWKAMGNLGVDPERLDAAQDDWYLAWTWIGVNLGIPPESIPVDFLAAEQLALDFAERHLRPSHASFELGRTLISEMRGAWMAPFNHTPKWLARSFASAAVRAMTRAPDPDSAHDYPIAEMLALPPSRIFTQRFARTALRAAAGESLICAPRGVVSKAILRRHANVSDRRL